MVEAGRFAWIGGGTHLTDTTHVDNVVEGLLLAAPKGRAGEAYFVTDGDRVVFREFVSALIKTQGVEPPTRSVPAAVAGPMAARREGVWRLLRLGGEPPLTRFASGSPPRSARSTSPRPGPSSAMRRSKTGQPGSPRSPKRRSVPASRSAAPDRLPRAVLPAASAALTLIFALAVRPEQRPAGRAGPCGGSSASAWSSRRPPAPSSSASA